MSNTIQQTVVEPQAVQKKNKPIKRFRFQFGTRFLLLITLVVALLLIPVTKVMKQHHAVQSLQQSGVYVVYDFQLADNLFNFTQPDEPPLLSDYLGKDATCRVEAVAFFGAASNQVVSKQDHSKQDDSKRITIVTQFQHLPHLRRLFIYNAGETDVSITKYPKWKTLEWIDFPCNPLLTGKTFDHWKDSPNLRQLNLRQCGITDEGLASITELKALEVLQLDAVAIQGKGLKHLGKLTKLKTLHLEKLKLGEHDFQFLKQLPQLEMLSLAHTSMLSLEELKCCPALKRLHLQHCNLTDEQLLPLAKIEQLEVLELSGNRVTSDGLQQLTQLRNLHTLHLNDLDLTDKDLPVLLELAKNNPLKVLGIDVISRDKVKFSEKSLDTIRQIRADIRFNAIPSW